MGENKGSSSKRSEEAGEKRDEEGVVKKGSLRKGRKKAMMSGKSEKEREGQGQG